MKLSIVVIQATGLCNLNCRYCYLPNRREKDKMPDSILSTTIKKVLESELVQDRIEFLWHAGEPLLAGIDFYQRAVELVKQYNSREIIIRQKLQTNALSINDEWCKFFLENKFAVGVSIDGPAFLHDANRKDWGGHSSHAKAMNGYELLKKYRINAGALCVLTKESLKYPEEIITFFAENGFPSVGFNLEEAENANEKSSLENDLEGSIKDLRRFMSVAFDLQQNKYPHLRIREMSRVYEILAEKRRNTNFYRIPPEIPPLNMLTIQKNGDITTYCPEFAGAKSVEYNNFVIGNILTDELYNLHTSPWFVKLANDVKKSIEMCASSCRYFDLCGSAPISNKYSENKTLLSTETVSCKLTYQVMPDVFIEKALAR